MSAVGERTNPDSEEKSMSKPQVRLSELARGEAGRIVAVGGSRLFRRRLLELGLVPGVEVRLVNVAPLGDPLELEVRHCRLSIRRGEAEQIVLAVPHEKRALRVLS